MVVDHVSEQTTQTNLQEREKPKTNKKSRCIQGRRLRRSVYRRLRRQTINEKMKALREIIPNCSKRGQASILDDAIKYIHNLQFQLHLMMSMRAVCSTFRPPMATPRQPGMQIPIDEMKYETATTSRSPAITHHQKSSARAGGSTARVLPTRIVLPHHHVHEDLSHYGASEW